MRRSLAACSLLTATLAPLGATAAPAAAAEPVHIVIDVPFDGSPGAFTTSGAGLCAGGSYTDSDILATGLDRGADRTFTFHLQRTFICSDGSGTFTVRLNARWTPCAPTNTGTWAVLRGTGAYTGLSGAGTLTGTYVGDPCDAEGVEDLLTGRVRLG